MKGEFASSEELYCSWYLKELVAGGYVESLEYQPKPFELTKPTWRNFQVHLKTKSKYKDFQLLPGSSYQADWAWFWTKKAENIFFAASADQDPRKFPFIAQFIVNSSKWLQVIDVKGTFNQDNSVRMFHMNQKFVMAKHGIYVQKIIPVPSVQKKKGSQVVIYVPANALFKASFIPKRYLLTDASGKARKINFEHKTLNQFINGRDNHTAPLSS